MGRNTMIETETFLISEKPLITHMQGKDVINDGYHLSPSSADERTAATKIKKANYRPACNKFNWKD